MEKTLIGKSGYLFLKNDSARELDVHCNNICLVHHDLSRYELFKHKFFLTIFPNKSLIQKEYLPDTYNAKYRPAFNIYKSFLQDKLLDGYEVVNSSMYYKTDTHINLLGAYSIYTLWVKAVNSTLNLSINPVPAQLIKETVSSLSSLQLGLGDLTWKTNLGEQVLSDLSDTYYSSEQIPIIVNKYIIKENDTIRLLNYSLHDTTSMYIDNVIDWTIISNNIIYVKNDGNSIGKRVVIFYDSFLLSTLSLYLNIFVEIFLIKDVYNVEILKKINPDLLFEFRCERFLF